MNKHIVWLRPGLIVTSMFLFAVFIMSQDGLAQSPGEELNQRLQRLREQMKVAANSLDDRAPDESLIDHQNKMVAELGLLIRQFSAGDQSGSQKNAAPRQSPGASESSTTQGSGQASADSAGGSSDNEISQTAITEKQLILKAWGEMPGQLRALRGSGISPEFLPRYDRLIREYYRRMSR